MSFEEGLALGLLLGKKKGGGGNNIFHRILDESIPVYTHDVGGGYTFTLAMLLCSPPETGIWNGVYANNVIDARVKEAAGDAVSFRHFLVMQYCVTEYGIVRKNGEPLYAVPEREHYSFSDPVSTWEVYDEADLRHDVFYRTAGEYSISDVRNVTVDYFTVFALGDDNPYAAHINYSCGVEWDYTLSYRPYINSTTSHYEYPSVTRSAERVSEQRHGVHFNAAEIFPRYNGEAAFTDLPFERFHAECQEIYHRMCIAAGVNTAPQIIIGPD